MKDFETIYSKAYLDGFMTIDMLRNSNDNLETSVIKALKDNDITLHNFLFNEWLIKSFNIEELTEKNYPEYCTLENFKTYLSEHNRKQRNMEEERVKEVRSNQIKCGALPTLKHRRQQVRAMKALLKHYQSQLNGQKNHFKRCPLCIAQIYHECVECVWVLETGQICNKFKHPVEYLREGDTSIPKQTLTKWRKRRIKELESWIKKYDK